MVRYRGETAAIHVGNDRGLPRLLRARGKDSRGNSDLDGGDDARDGDDVSPFARDVAFLRSSAKSASNTHIDIPIL